MSWTIDSASLEAQARLFTRGAYAGSEIRPNLAGLEENSHPRAVLRLLEQANLSSPEARAAAWLLPAVERTATMIEDIREVFGSEVADLVRAAVPEKEPSEATTVEEMLAQERAIVAGSSSLAQTLAVCSIIADIETDADGAVDMLDHYAAWLEGATQAQPFLRRRAQRSIEAGLATIEE